MVLEFLEVRYVISQFIAVFDEMVVTGLGSKIDQYDFDFECSCCDPVRPQDP